MVWRSIRGTGCTSLGDSFLAKTQIATGVQPGKGEQNVPRASAILIDYLHYCLLRPSTFHGMWTVKDLHNRIRQALLADTAENYNRTAEASLIYAKGSGQKLRLADAKADR